MYSDIELRGLPPQVLFKESVFLVLETSLVFRDAPVQVEPHKNAATVQKHADVVS